MGVFYVKVCGRCNTENETNRRMFCSACGFVLDRDSLKRVRLMGPVGVLHSNSPKIEAFWETGDPAVLD